MAKKDGALHLAQLQERGIRRVLHTIARKAPQNLLRLGGAKTQSSGKFDFSRVGLFRQTLLPLRT